MALNRNQRVVLGLGVGAGLLVFLARRAKAAPPPPPPEQLIDVGARGAAGNSATPDYTFIEGTNPLDLAGVLDTLYIRYTSGGASGVKVGLFYKPDPVGFPNHFTCRGSYILGPVSPEEQILAIVLSGQKGDFLGSYAAEGWHSFANLGTDSWLLAGDQMACVNSEFGVVTNGTFWLYAEGLST